MQPCTATWRWVFLPQVVADLKMQVVKKSSRSAMHEFFRKTGKWRRESFVQLAIARAWLCDPTVLILATLSLGMPKIFD
jgi:hypothetical protein